MLARLHDKLIESKFTLFSVSEEFIEKQTYMKTETSKLYSIVY